jgi:hypothetical protein
MRKIDGGERVPHIVLNGRENLDDIFDVLKNVSLRNESGIIKTSDRYINHEKTAILIESLAIENGVNRGFLTMVSRRDDGVVVRIYPRSDVEKTPGVKMILAQIAKQIIEISPGFSIGETNLSEYLK